MGDAHSHKSIVHIQQATKTKNPKSHLSMVNPMSDSAECFICQCTVLNLKICNYLLLNIIKIWYFKNIHSSKSISYILQFILIY